jgi:hypothetical protein
VLFHFCLAAEIGKIRAAIGIGDADVHEAPNAGALGGVEQYLRVGERLRKGEMRRLVEPDPVGVDQDVEATERLFEQVGPREIIGKRLDGFAKRISTVR